MRELARLGRGRAALAPLLVATAVACASVRADSDFDPEFDFSRFETFSFAPHAKVPEGAVDRGFGGNPLIVRRIERAIVGDLTAKGYRAIEEGRPDFRVGFHVGSEQRVRVTSGPEPVGGYVPYHGYMYGGYMRAHGYTQGQLVIDIIDVASEGVVWHGWAHKVIHASDSHDEEIRAAVAKTLAGFPPSSHAE